MNKSIKEFEKENPTPKLIASKFFYMCLYRAGNY